MRKMIHVVLICGISLSLFLSCMRFDILFANNDISAERGYTRDELLLFLDFAKLAAIDYDGINQDELSFLKDSMQHAVKVGTVSYASTYGSESVTGSASYVHPSDVAPSDGWPLLVSMHHTLLRDVEAPSYVAEDAPSFDFNKISDFQPSLHPILISSSLGFAIYSPDMLGFGASKDKVHPFMNSDWLMDDIYRGMLATIKTMEDKGIPINEKKIYITGYSHGGWVAVKFHEYLNTQHPEYPVVATVSSGGVYYLQELIQDLMSKESTNLALFFPYMIYGYIDSGTLPTRMYSDFFNAPYNALDFKGDLFDGTNNNQYVDEKLSSDIATLYQATFINAYKTGGTGVVSGAPYTDFWTQAKKDSAGDTTTGTWQLSGRLLIIHHTEDEVSPIGQVNNFINNMRTVNGDRIESTLGIWGEGSAHEATALMTYLHGLHWLVKLK